MLKHVRLATKEEVEGIRSTSNFPPQFAVYAMDHGEGQTDLAVVKQVVELDPVHFSEKTNTIQRAKFIWALEERMSGAGITQYYTGSKASDEKWIQTIEQWGAKATTDFPVIRFLKELQ